MDDYYANYLYVDTADSYLKTIEAKVVFTDGTEKKVTIDNEWVNGTEMNVADVEKAYNNGGLVGGVYAYSVDDDVYTLRPILDMDEPGGPREPEQPVQELQGCGLQCDRRRRRDHQ